MYIFRVTGNPYPTSEQIYSDTNGEKDLTQPAYFSWSGGMFVCKHTHKQASSQKFCFLFSKFTEVWLTNKIVYMEGVQCDEWCTSRLWNDYHNQVKTPSSHIVIILYVCVFIICFKGVLCHMLANFKILYGLTVVLSTSHQEMSCWGRNEWSKGYLNGQNKSILAFTWLHVGSEKQIHKSDGRELAW